MGEEGQVIPRIMVFEDDRLTQLMVEKQVLKELPHAQLEFRDQVYTAAPEILSFKPHAIIMDFQFNRHTSACLIPFLYKMEIETYFYTSSPELVRKVCLEALGSVPKFIHVYSKQSHRPVVFRRIRKYLETIKCLRA